MGRKHSRRHAQNPRESATSVAQTWPAKTAGAVLLSAIAIAAYWPALHGSFVLDDDLLLTKNPLVQSSNGLSRIWFTTEPVDYWPVTNSLFWLEWRLWGENPTGYHLVNLALHIVNAWLLYAVLKQLAIPGAYWAALLFAIHPVNVESVAWIAQLKNVLSMSFFLLSIWFYLRFDVRTTTAYTPAKPNEKPESKNKRRDPEPNGVWKWYFLSFFAFILAMLSKGSVAVLPPLLLLITWWRFERLNGRDLLRLAPFFAVAVLLSLVNISFQSHWHAEQGRTIEWIGRLLAAPAIGWFYLYKAIVPLNLAFVYPNWHVEASNILWWFPLTAALAVTVILGCVRRRRFGRHLLFAWLFFWIALSPVLGFVNIKYMNYSLVADHYQYIAILAVVTLAAAMATYAIQQFAGRKVIVARAAFGLVVVILAGLTWRQSGLYASPLVLYQDTLEKNPDALPAHDNLAIALMKAGQTREAIEHCQQALRLDPSDAIAHNTLGLIFTNAGRQHDALEHFEAAERLTPEDAVGHLNYGNALLGLGRAAEAVTQYQAAIKIRSSYVLAWNNLAVASANLARWSDAVAAAEKALQLADSSGNRRLAEDIQSRLVQYRANLSKAATPQQNSQ
jgi:protein O-mannosyl-transferase